MLCLFLSPFFHPAFRLKGFPGLGPPFPSFSDGDVHPPQRSPDHPRLLPDGKIPSSCVSLDGNAFLGLPLLGTGALPPPQLVGLICPERTPSWKRSWRGFPSSSSYLVCLDWDCSLGKERAAFSGSRFLTICSGCLKTVVIGGSWRNRDSLSSPETSPRNHPHCHH